MEGGIGHRRVKLPVGETELDGDAAGVLERKAGEVGGFFREFEENGGGCGRRGWGLRGVGGGIAEIATETDKTSGGGRLWGNGANAGADARELHFAGEERERRAPVFAGFRWDAGDGVVGGDVEPGELAIHEEEIVFGRLVFPAHLARAAEGGNAGLDANLAAVFGVPLEEGGAKSVGRPIAGFEPVEKRL